MDTVIAYARDILTIALCVLGCVFAIAGVVGLYRFPDSYTRLQASGLAGTSATFTFFLAALVSSSDWATAGRIMLIILFYFVSCPTVTHIIARFAWQSGLDPWAPAKKDNKKLFPIKDEKKDHRS